MNNKKFTRIFIEQMQWPSKFSMEKDHMHPFFELYYQMEGTRTMFINHSFYPLHPNDLVLIRSGDLHHTTYQEDGPSERFLIYFEEELFSSLYKAYPPSVFRNLFSYPKLSIPPSMQKQVLSLLFTLRKEYDHMDAYSMKLLEHLLNTLLLLLLRLHTSSVHKQPKQIEDPDIAIAARYICTNFEKDLSLNKISSLVNITPTYFSKKFKVMTGFGFTEYVTMVRLKEARKRLLETSDSITTIALECGFNNSNYFADCFKKLYHESPRTYRNSHK